MPSGTMDTTSLGMDGQRDLTGKRCVGRNAHFQQIVVVVARGIEQDGGRRTESGQMRPPSGNSVQRGPLPGRKGRESYGRCGRKDGLHLRAQVSAEKRIAGQRLHHVHTHPVCHDQHDVVGVADGGRDIGGVGREFEAGHSGQLDYCPGQVNKVVHIVAGAVESPSLESLDKMLYSYHDGCVPCE